MMAQQQNVRIPKSAQRLADNWNNYILEQREMTERRARFLKRKQQAKDATSRRKAKFYAKTGDGEVEHARKR